METGEVVGVVLITLLVTGILVGLITSIVSGINFQEAKPCLENIAADYCESNNLIFEKAYRNGGERFICKIDERALDNLYFKFTDEDKNECYK